MPTAGELSGVNETRRRVWFLLVVVSLFVGGMSILHTLPGPDWTLVSFMTALTALVYIPAEILERLLGLRRGIVGGLVMIAVFFFAVIILPIGREWPLVVYGMLLGRLYGLANGARADVGQYGRAGS